MSKLTAEINIRRQQEEEEEKKKQQNKKAKSGGSSTSAASTNSANDAAKAALAALDSLPQGQNAKATTAKSATKGAEKKPTEFKTTAQKTTKERRTTSGGYYSQPEPDTRDINKYARQMDRYSSQLPGLSDDYNAKNQRAAEAESLVRDTEETLKKLAANGRRGGTQSSVYDKLYQNYTKVYDDYDKAVAEAQDAANKYNRLLEMYGHAYEGYNNAYATIRQQQDEWRGTIRDDQDAIRAELVDTRGRYKSLEEQRSALNEQLNALQSGQMGVNDPGAAAAQIALLQKQIRDIDRLIHDEEQNVNLVQEELDNSIYYGYEKYRTAPDFAQKSMYVPTVEDKDYRIINSKYTLAGTSQHSATDMTDRQLVTLQMTDDEIAMYNYLHATDPDKAEEYMTWLTKTLNARYRQKTTKNVQDIAASGPVGAIGMSALSVPMRTIGGVTSFVGQVADYIGDGEIDQNAPYNAGSYIPTAIRSEVAKEIQESGKWGKWGSLGYQTAMSMADFLFNAAITGNLGGGLEGTAAKVAENASLALMGSGAAADTVIEAKDRGLSDSQAMTLGIWAGAAEIITERVSLETLLDKAGMGKNALTYWLKNFVAEGSEEVASDFINLFAEEIIAKDKSQWHEAILQYMAQGMSESEAFAKALKDQAISTGLSFLGGAISGGVMAGANIVLGSFKNANRGSAINRGAVDAEAMRVIEQGMAAEPGTPARAYAEQLQKLQAEGKTISERQVQKMSQLNGETADVARKNIRETRNEAAREVIEKGLASEENSPLRNYAEKLQKRMAGGKELTNYQTGKLQTLTQENAISEAQKRMERAEQQRIYRNSLAYTPTAEDMRTDTSVMARTVRGSRTDTEPVAAVNMPQSADEEGTRAPSYAVARQMVEQRELTIAKETKQAVDAVAAQGQIEAVFNDGEMKLFTAPVMIMGQQTNVGVLAETDPETGTVSNILKAVDENGNVLYDTAPAATETDTETAAETENATEENMAPEAEQAAGGVVLPTAEDTRGVVLPGGETMNQQQNINTTQEVQQNGTAGQQDQSARSGAGIVLPGGEQETGAVLVGDRRGDVYRGDAGGRRNDAGGRSAQYLRQNAESEAERAEHRGLIRQRQQASIDNPLVSGRELGFSTGTEEQTLRVYSESSYDQVAQRCYDDLRANGFDDVTFVVGALMADRGDGGVAVNDITNPRTGKTVIRCDGLKMTLPEITRHVIAHRVATQERVQQFRDSVKGSYNEAAWGRMYETYKAAWGRLTNQYEGMTNDEVELYVWEEIMGDAYANVNNYGQRASVYNGEARAALEGAAVQPGMVQQQQSTAPVLPTAENAAATEQTNGPPAGENFSVAEEERGYGVMLPGAEAETAETEPEAEEPTEGTEPESEKMTAVQNVERYSFNPETIDYAINYTVQDEQTRGQLQLLKDNTVELADIQSRINEEMPGRAAKNIHTLNDYLNEHRDVWQQLWDMQQEMNAAGIRCDFVTEPGTPNVIEGKEVAGGLKGLPIEYVESTTGKRYKFTAFWRQMPQMMLDSMAHDSRERMRGELVKAVEDAYRRGTGEKNLMPYFADQFPTDAEVKKVGGARKASNVQSQTYEKVQVPLRSAEKTVMALNLNSACPMFTIGNNGCYLDACYLTQMANGATGTNLFRSAWYTGEILQVADSDIDLMNRLGGLRINGVGDTTLDNKSQLQDVIRHAGMRGLKTKMITKQRASLEVLAELHNQGVDISHVTVQPSMDNLWIPAELDDVYGAGVRGTTQIAETVRRGNTEAAATGYEEMFGRATKIVDGQLYRKYGFSPEQIREMKADYPFVQITPRYVVCTAAEIAEIALNRDGEYVNGGKVIQTLMHGKVPQGCVSDYPGELLNFGGARHVVAKENGQWRFYGEYIGKDGKVGKVIDGPNTPYGKVMDFVQANYTPQEQNKIWTTLRNQMCCQANDFKDACAGCQSLCARGCSAFSSQDFDYREYTKQDKADAMAGVRAAADEIVAKRSGAEAEAGSGEGGTRYSIEEIDGRMMPVIDTENDTRDFDAAESYLDALVKTAAEKADPFATILRDSQPVYIGKDLPGEYRGSKYTQKMRSALRDVKMQAATNLDEMLLLAENGEWKEDVDQKHGKSAENGWYYYDTEFAVPVKDIRGDIDHYTIYGGTLLIRNDADGKSYLYDLIDLNEKKKVISSSASARSANGPAVFEPKPSFEYTVSQTGEESNREIEATSPANMLPGNEAETPVSQAINSAKTSIKQIPALFKNPNVHFGDTNIDIGGGRFNLATEYLNSIGTENMVFDPYNRGAEENSATLQYLQNGNKADTATCANVLNVIEEPEARANVILETAKAIKPDGAAYFMVYEGDSSGIGRETSSGWQNNRKTADYVQEIGQYFDTVERRGKLIIATNPKADLPQAAWEIQPGTAIRYSAASENPPAATASKEEWQQWLQDRGFNSIDEYVASAEAKARADKADRMRNISKADFKGTDALEKLDIRIENSVGRYENLEMLKEADKAAKSVQRLAKKAEIRLRATAAEENFADGIAAGVYSEYDIPSTMRKDVVMELADYYVGEQAMGAERIRQQKAIISTALAEKMEGLFKDSDKYKPSPAIVLNYRTPERNMLHIFGDKNGKVINDALFTPVAVNEAERYRFVNRMHDEVRTFESKDGKQKKLNKAERAIVQQVIEGKVVAETVAGMEMRSAIESAAQKIRKGEDIGAVAEEYNLSPETQKTAIKYARWLETQDAMTSGKVDPVKVENAVKKYSEQFDLFYNAINDFLVAHGYEPIGFIKGYAPHMQPDENQNILNKAFQAMGINTDVTRLPTSIAGLTANYKPSKRWNPYFLSRTGDVTKYDIATAYESYVDYMSDVLYHTDDIMRVREASKYFRRTYAPEENKAKLSYANELRYGTTDQKLRFLRDQNVIDKAAVAMRDADVSAQMEEYIEKLYNDIEKTTKYSDLVMWLDNYANILAGKQSMGDRSSESKWGRKALNLGNRVVRAFGKANVAGSLSSMLNQSAQIPMIQAELGNRWTAAAIYDILTGRVRKGGWEGQSDFITGKKGIDYLVKTPGDMVLTAMFKPAEIMDTFVAETAVRGKYLKEIHAGKSHAEAMKAADAFGTAVMGSRMKGSKPVAFHSKNMVDQMINIFQIEALNSWEHISQDLPRDFREIAEKQGKAKAALALAGVIAKMLVFAFLANRIADKVYGGTPAPFDLAGLTMNFIASGEGLSTNEYLETIIDNGLEKLTGERIFNTDESKLDDEPFDWGAATKDLGYNISNEIPFFRNVSGLLGWGDETLPMPDVYGTGKDLIEAVKNYGVSWPGAKAAISFLGQFLPGGRQLTKTVQGLETVVRGGDYSGYGEKEKLKYPTSGGVLSDIQAILFGKYATAANDAYYAEGKKALSENQTALWRSLTERGADRQDAYDAIQQWRKIDNDETLSTEEKKDREQNLLSGLDFTDEQKLLMYGVLTGADTRAAKFQSVMDAGASFDQILDIYNDFQTISNTEGLDSAEKGRQQRDLLRGNGMTDEQKLLLYNILTDADSRTEKFRAIMDEGVDFDTVLDIYDQYTAIDEEDLGSTGKATEFAYWLDQNGFTPEQATAARKNLTYFTGGAAEASGYDELKELELSDDHAKRLEDDRSLLEPEDGKTQVSDMQFYRLVASSDYLTDKEKIAAIGSVMGTEMTTDTGNPSQYAKLKAAISDGLTFDEYLDLKDVGAEDLYYKAVHERDVKPSIAYKVSKAIKSESTDKYEIDAEKWIAAADMYSNPADQLQAVRVVCDNDHYAKFELAYSFPAEYRIEPEVLAAYYAAVKKFDQPKGKSGHGSYGNQELEDAVYLLTGGSYGGVSLPGGGTYQLTNAQKAALWQLIKPGTSAKNNPFSTSVGSAVSAAKKAAGDDD